MNRVFIIAEAGVNHNGSLETAKLLVDMAVRCGADAVKFQTFKAAKVVTKHAQKARYQKENMQNDSGTQYEMLKRLELENDEFKVLQAYCSDKNIIFLSSPFDEESLRYLVGLNVPIIKIGSTEITNLQYLKIIGATQKKLILSTGMSSLGEVETAIDAIKSTGNTDVTLLHCTTNYPTPAGEVNLNAMLTLKNAFKLDVGYSDHTEGCDAAVAAVALGASIIEKHITLNKAMEGPDHKASMDEQGFKQYVTSIRNTESLMGDGIKKPTASEVEISAIARRSAVAKRAISSGSVLTEEDIIFKRPGIGLQHDTVKLLLGKKTIRDIQEDEMIEMGHFIE